MVRRRSRSIPENALQFDALRSFGRQFPAAVARLMHHRSTLDPFLDDSGPSMLRLGSVTLDGETRSALEASPAADLVLEVGTSDASRLTVPCAVRSPAGARVEFDVTISGEGRPPVSRSLVVEGAGIGRWHEITIAVPAGRPSIAMRTRVIADPGGVRACWGIPTLSWRKRTRALLYSAAFMLRAHGIAGTARQVRGKLADTGNANYAAWLARRAPDAAALAAMRAAVETLPSPPLFALVLEGERLTTRIALAGAAIFAGVGVVIWAEWRRRRLTA